MRTYVWAVLCAGLIFGGCNQGKYATQPSESSSWQSAYDAPWASVTACWGVSPAKPNVVVRDEPHHFIDEWGRDVHGYFLAPNTVVVAADLAALSHEFSHAVRFSLTGDAGENTKGGCFDVK